MNKEHEKLSSAAQILGYNLIALVAYSIICRLLDHNFIIDAFFIMSHMLFALLMAGMYDERRKVWLLSCLLILLLGYTTCGFFVS